MVSFPNAKINLGLNIIGKREDGYHNIETVFYPIGWSDILEIVAAKSATAPVQFKITGSKLIGSKQKNLCLAAYHLLKEKYNLPSVQMHLHKMIPVGAGLGGGSSDAAATLLLLNKIFNLNISENDLKQLAASLGADCAFFIQNKPLFAKGKGDEFEGISLNLEKYFIVVVKPDVYVSTESAYKNIKPTVPALSIKEIIAKPVQEWKGLLVNDFEDKIFKKHPVIRHIKDELYNSGAVYASMSGSGSAVYGIFVRKDSFGEEEINLKSKFAEHEVWSGRG
jgi:4-diphosphocytidyl-2-C-methyl-D-erythritol kinase